MVLALSMTWTHCEVYWDLDFEPSKTSGGQPVALGASVFGLHFWDSIDHFDFVTSLFSRRDFVDMLVIPWWDLYPWWPLVAFCGLL